MYIYTHNLLRVGTTSFFSTLLIILSHALNHTRNEERQTPSQVYLIDVDVGALRKLELLLNGI